MCWEFNDLSSKPWLFLGRRAGWKRKAGILTGHREAPYIHLAAKQEKRGSSHRLNGYQHAGDHPGVHSGGRSVACIIMMGIHECSHCWWTLHYVIRLSAGALQQECGVHQCYLTLSDPLTLDKKGTG